MTQYKTLKVKLSCSESNTLKSGIKNGPEITLNFSSNVIGKFNDETNFLHSFLLTNTQFSRLHKVFANNSSAIINCQILSDYQRIILYKIEHSGRFLVDFQDH